MEFLSLAAYLHRRYAAYICHLWKSFTQPSALKKHMLIHTGDELFTCGTYGKRFTELSNSKNIRLFTKEISHLLVALVANILLSHLPSRDIRVYPQDISLTNVKIKETHAYTYRRSASYM